MTDPFSDSSGGPTLPPPPSGPGVPPPPPPQGQFGAPAPTYHGAPPPGYQPYTQHATLPFASFWARFGAWLLDGLLYGLLGLAIAIPGIVLFVQAFDGCVTINNDTVCPPGKPEGSNIALGILFFIVAVVLVFGLYVRALGKTGQTWGRKIAGVKVVQQRTNQPIGIGRAIGRQLFASFISGQVFYLGYLWMLWDKNKQTWHDKVVDSIVVKT